MEKKVKRYFLDYIFDKTEIVLDLNRNFKIEKDTNNARKLRDDMSKQIHELYKELYSFGDFWNSLAPRIEQ